MAEAIRWTRRQFMGAAGAAGAAAALSNKAASGQPAEKPRSTTPASDRIVLGLIGCGGQGAFNMRVLMDKPGVQVAALCDVDSARIPNDARFVEMKQGRKPDIYKDFRHILDRKDIDAVIIGTPDHWHALPLVMACEAGKDAFCEKPISHDITEARAMDGAVRHFKRIVQVGSWQRSTREFTDALAFVRAGKIGRIVVTRAWKTDDSNVGHADPSQPPSSLDYDFWTGPAAMVPYAANHVHGAWRWFLNYGTGMTGDWGVHMIDIALLGMSSTTDLPMPSEVTSYGGKFAYPNSDRTAPDTVQSIMRFRDPEFVLHWETGRDFPGKPDHGTEFVSVDGRTVRVWRGGWTVLDPAGHELPKESAPPTNDHWQNWLDCVRSREQPRSNLSSMAQTTIVCHLANASLLAGETVRWSRADMDVVGRAGRGTGSYFREYRKPWKLPIYKV